MSSLMGQFSSHNETAVSSADKLYAVAELLKPLGSRHQIRARIDAITLEFAVEGGSADTEHFEGYGFVAVDLIKHTLDSQTFDVFKVRQCQSRMILSVASRTIHYSRRQITYIYGLPVAQGSRALNAVFELANIAWPLVLQQTLHGCARDLSRRILRGTVQEPLDEQRDIGTAVTQGRQLQGDNI